MTSQLPCLWCLFLSCQQQKTHQKWGSCDIIKVLLICYDFSQVVRFGFVSLFIILSGDWVSSFGPVLDQHAI